MRFIPFYIKTFLAKWILGLVFNRVKYFIKKTFNMRNLFGDGVGTWWEMRKKI
ncbi:MAG: hypothetical protein H0Z39_02505 [Peptococcaceae bacterium]|nr:hypothetical protein [Peptococcaceae bacterium]